MITPGQELAALLAQHQQQWLEHVARLEQKLQLLQTLKKGMELLLLVASYLFYYLMDCIAQVMAMPMPFVR